MIETRHLIAMLDNFDFTIDGKTWSLWKDYKEEIIKRLKEHEELKSRQKDEHT